MTETEKIEYTKNFIDKMANGINPLDDTPIPETDLLNNIRISRCMFYVCGLLQKMIDGAQAPFLPSEKKKKLPFAVTREQLGGYPFEEFPIPISKIAEKINSLISFDDMEKLKYTSIYEFLIGQGYLASVGENGKTYKRPTPRGKELGITTEKRIGTHNEEYLAVLYDVNAQQYVLNHIDEIAEINNTPAETKRKWTAKQYETLANMFKDGIVIDDIAAELDHTRDEVLSKLKALGLIDDISDAT